MSRRDKVTDAVAGMFRQKPGVAASNVVPIEPDQAPAALERKTVANSAARSMLYLPPLVKRKFKEIAFHEDRREHDVYIDALREYLEKRGHGGLL
jgi:hypothetical protein